MARTVIFMMWALGMTGCTAGHLGGLLLGGGPNVAANTQIGKENHQTIGATSSTEIATDTVEQLVVNQAPTLLIIFLIALAVVGTIGWLAPRPKFLDKKK